jgi:hypothetical protein
MHASWRHHYSVRQTVSRRRLTRPQNLINLGEALVYACRLPDPFLHIDKSMMLALAHSLWSDVFVDGR